MPVRTYDAKPQTGEEFYKIVTEADKKGWVMAAGCETKHASLYTGHAYTLLGTVVLTDGP